MVKGLLIRQTLSAVNILFALAIAYIIYLAGMQLLGRSPLVNPVDDLGTTPADAIQIAQVGPRSEYDDIVNGRLFGNAGTVAAPVAADTAPVATEVVPTTAPFKLYATVASYPTDPLATAIIENPNVNAPIKTSTYYLGQPITDQYKLLEVHRRQVVLLNTAKNQREVLQMDSSAAGAATLARNMADSSRTARMAGGELPNVVTLDRSAVVEEIGKYDYNDLITQLNPTLVEDDNGNITGITSATLSNIPIAKQAGLRDNDVIQAVNGITIDSEEKIGQIAQKVGNQNTIRLSVLRDGKPQLITVKVQ